MSALIAFLGAWFTWSGASLLLENFGVQAEAAQLGAIAAAVLVGRAAWASRPEVRGRRPVVGPSERARVRDVLSASCAVAAGWCALLGGMRALDTLVMPRLPAEVSLATVLRVQLATGVLAAALAGALAARLDAARPRRAAGCVALFALAWALLQHGATLTQHVYAPESPDWLFISGALLWPAAALAGAAGARR